MTFRTTPLWTDQAPLPGPREGDGAPPQAADVAIVGGGYTGLSAARALARRGARVVVLERGDLGAGASSRNAGQVLVGLSRDASDLATQWGRERAQRLWEAGRDGIRAVGRLCHSEGIACDFSPRGSLFLAAKPAHFVEMQRESEWLALHFGYRRLDVTRSALSDEIGSDAFHGGTLDPEGAALHPAKWLCGLAQSAARAGALLCPRTPVQAIETQRSRHAIRHAGGTLRVSDVLIATNGYSDGRVAGLREVSRSVLPATSAIIATEPLPLSLCQRLSPKGRVFYDSKRRLSYFRLTPDGRMVFGGRAGSRESPARCAKRLRRALVAVFPALCDFEITHCWSGRVALTRDSLPHLSRHRGIHFALGYGGHGVALSYVLGSAAGELIAGGDRTSPFLLEASPCRFSAARRWTRPLRSIALGVLDRID